VTAVDGSQMSMVRRNAVRHEHAVPTIAAVDANTALLGAYRIIISFRVFNELFSCWCLFVKWPLNLCWFFRVIMLFVLCNCRWSLMVVAFQQTSFILILFYIVSCCFRSSEEQSSITRHCCRLSIFRCRHKSHFFSLSYYRLRWLFSLLYSARAVTRHFGHSNQSLPGVTFNILTFTSIDWLQQSSVSVSNRSRSIVPGSHSRQSSNGAAGVRWAWLSEAN